MAPNQRGSTPGGEVRGKRQPPCWWCSRPLSNPFGKPIKGVERTVDGNKVRMHEVCSHSFDEDFRQITAQPRMIATPSPYDCGGNPTKDYPGD